MESPFYTKIPSVKDGILRELVMGVGPMNLVITNDALYQLSYTSEPFMTLTASTGYIILSYADICKDFF